MASSVLLASLMSAGSELMMEAIEREEMNARDVLHVSHVLIPRSGKLRLKRKQEDGMGSHRKRDPVQPAKPSTRCESPDPWRNLCPAAVPSDPMESPGRSALSGLAKELAWIVEETCYLLPPTAEKDTCAPILLEYTWRHASLGLRQLLLTVYGQEMQGFHFDVTLATSRELAEQLPSLNVMEGTRLVGVGWDQNEFDALRSEVRGALRLRFRRSERVENDVNTIVGLRWRAAVEELGDVNDPNYVENIMKPKIKYRRKRNSLDELFKLAGSMDCDNDSEEIAKKVPLELNAIEEELAWLTEESILLLNNSSTAKEPRNGSELLVTRSVDSDINWEFVLSNASESLRKIIERVGVDRRYPLQRLIRQHDPDVKTSFAKRRDEIAGLLVLKAYRRNQLRNKLPSQENLASTGFDQILSIRLLRRRRQIAVTEDTATNEDLIDACNQRLPTPTKKRMRQLVKKQASDVDKIFPTTVPPLGSIANIRAAYRRNVTSIERMAFTVTKLTPQSPLGLQLCLAGRNSMKIKHVGPGPCTQFNLMSGCIIDVINGKCYSSFKEGVAMLKEAVGQVQIIASASHGVQYGGKTYSETKELLDQMTERASHEILSALSSSERRDIQNRTQIVAQVMALVGFPDRECRHPNDQMIIIEACQKYSNRLPAPKSKDHTTRLALTEPRPQATRPEFANQVSESSKQDEQSAGSSASGIDFTSSDESNAHADDDDEDYEQEEESEDDEDEVY